MIERSYRSTGPSVASRSLNLRIPLPKMSPVIVVASVFAILIVSVTTWLLIIKSSKPAIIDPYDARLVASMKYPMYYSTGLPAGYSYDLKSIQQPAEGVVVITMKDAAGHKIYMSEQARDGTTNIGGLYTTLKKGQVTGVSDGAIATGYFNSELVASRANNTTWLWVNTNVSSVTRNQLVTLLQDIKSTAQ